MEPPFDSMKDDGSTTALIARWRALRMRQLPPITGRLNVTLDPVTLHATGTVTNPPSVGGGAAALHLNAEGEGYAPPPDPPELLVGLIVPGIQNDEGVIIEAVTPVWRRFLNELASDPKAFWQLDWRQTEELIAGAYREYGWRVTLTPRSGDMGSDIIAHRDDIGDIRLLDQVKRYEAGRLVSANDVRAMLGVLTRDQKASKAVITTTSRFAPGIANEFAAFMPTRLQLRDGTDLRDWLQRLAGLPR